MGLIKLEDMIIGFITEYWFRISNDRVPGVSRSRGKPLVRCIPGDIRYFTSLTPYGGNTATRAGNEDWRRGAVSTNTVTSIVLSGSMAGHLCG